jgi:hypothetical protein
LHLSTPPQRVECWLNYLSGKNEDDANAYNRPCTILNR